MHSSVSLSFLDLFCALKPSSMCEVWLKSYLIGIGFVFLLHNKECKFNSSTTHTNPEWLIQPNKLKSTACIYVDYVFINSNELDLVQVRNSWEKHYLLGGKFSYLTMIKLKLLLYCSKCHCHSSLKCLNNNKNQYEWNCCSWERFTLRDKKDFLVFWIEVGSG